MNVEITFHDGPIEAEISATEDEEYTEVLKQLADFVDEHNNRDRSSSQSEAHQNLDKPDQEDENNSSEQTVEVGSDRSNSYFSDVDVTNAELQRVLKMGTTEDGDVNDFPEIIGNTDVLGESEHDRLLNEAVIILTTLEEAHNISTVKTTDLKDALANSGLPEDNWGNVSKSDNLDIYLDRDGSGASATTTIREPGKDDAYELIESLVIDFRESDDDDID